MPLTMQNHAISLPAASAHIMQRGLGLLALTFGVLLLMANPAHAQATNDLSLDLMLARFIKDIAKPMLTITYVGAYIFGAYLLVKGLLKCVKYSDEGSKGQQKFSGLWGNLLIGALLMALPSSMNSIAGTLYSDAGASFGETAMEYANQILRYDTVTDPDIQAKLNRTYWTIITFVQILGLISFVRGLSILRSVTDGNTQVTSMAGLTHVVAGAIAWNLGEFVQVIFNTVGFEMRI